MFRTPCLLRVYGYERKIMVLIITVLSEVSQLEQQFFLICLCLCLRINIFLTHPFIPAVIKKLSVSFTVGTLDIFHLQAQLN